MGRPRRVLTCRHVVHAHLGPASRNERRRPSSPWLARASSYCAYVARQIRNAYDSATAATAKKKLLQLASWLDSNGHEDAAASLREGLDETLTVMRIGLTGTLRRTFSTTNPIENMNGSLRRVTRNVKRWKDEAMIRRWVALGIAEAQKGFRRVMGYVHMPSLVAALRPAAATVASEKKVA